MVNHRRITMLPRIVIQIFLAIRFWHDDPLVLLAIIIRRSAIAIFRLIPILCPCFARFMLPILCLSNHDCSHNIKIMSVLYQRA